MLTKLIKDFFEAESGQGITEYGAVMGFIAVLCALAFSLSQGSMQGSLKNSFSSVANTMSLLVSNGS